MNDQTFDPYQDDPTTQVRRSFTVTSPGRVRLQAPNADVAVRHEATDQITIEVNSDGVDLAPIRLDQQGDQVVLEVPDLQRNDPGRGLFNFSLGSFSLNIGGGSPSLRIFVTAPIGADLDLRVQRGDISVAGESGSLAVESHSGDVTAEAIARGRINTTSGDVTVGRSGALKVTSGAGDVSIEEAGDCELRTGSGDLSVNRVHGFAQLSTGSGDVTVGPVDGPAEAKTGSGDVTLARVAGPLAQVRTGSGDVSIGLPTGVPIWQDISTVVGEVHSHLENLGEPAEGQEHITVRVNTGSGDVTLDHA